MDRKGQLRNVAFGGDWAELIDPRECLEEALSRIDKAAEESIDKDLRNDDNVKEAVRFASQFGIKGMDLILAWERALNFHNPALRQVELTRIAHLFRSGSAVG